MQTDRSLLSPPAQRLLALLSPEAVSVSYRNASAPGLLELQRLGLVSVQWGNDHCLVSLTHEGRRWSLRVN